MTKKLTSLTLVLGLSLTAFAGCSGGDDGKDKAPASEQQSAPGPEEPMTWPAGIAKVKGFKPVSGGIGASTFGPCDLGPGPHTIKGTVTSSSAETRDFAAIVTWTDEVGKVVGQGSQVVRAVAPGGEAKFVVKGTVKRAASQCLPAVLAGAADAG